MQSPAYIPATIFHDSAPTPQQSTTPNSQVIEIKSEKNWKITDEYLSNYQSYSSPISSPPQDIFMTIYTPPSPASSTTSSSDYNILTTVKQEFGCNFLPPSPPDSIISESVPSPISDIKSEPDTDSEVCIDIETFLLSNSFEILKPEVIVAKKQDHQLLREYLTDTSFQKKHNLKPLALESLIGGWGTRGDIEPVISLALEHARRDFETTWTALEISPG